jgi:protocatechuate 3,4-dioxygenase beta subunit
MQIFPGKHYSLTSKLILMERKAFLKNSIGLFSVMTLLDACKKTDVSSSATTTATNAGSSACRVSPTETEGPYPYPGGEATNPLQRADVTGGQTGVPLTLALQVVNTNNSCAAVSGARVDIWQCNKDGYYSGYAAQPGINGTQSYVGATWLRGYQLTDSNGAAGFTTIYPGWYSGRATHIHFEVYVGGVLKKVGQMAFAESISDVVHVSSAYAAHGVNTTRNAADSVFGDSATDLANETLSLAGSVSAGYTGSYTIGVPL